MRKKIPPGGCGAVVFSWDGTLDSFDIDAAMREIRAWLDSEHGTDYPMNIIDGPLESYKYAPMPMGAEPDGPKISYMIVEVPMREEGFTGSTPLRG